VREHLCVCAVGIIIALSMLTSSRCTCSLHADAHVANRRGHHIFQPAIRTSCRKVAAAAVLQRRVEEPAGYQPPGPCLPTSRALMLLAHSQTPFPGSMSSPPCPRSVGVYPLSQCPLYCHELFFFSFFSKKKKLFLGAVDGRRTRKLMRQTFE
jgi:hypothetical protein